VDEELGREEEKSEKEQPSKRRIAPYPSFWIVHPTKKI
jgi:hypothetical protein